jgi:hypothetical protein
MHWARGLVDDAFVGVRATTIDSRGSDPLSPANVARAA